MQYQGLQMRSPVELPIQNACKAYDQGDYKTANRLFKQNITKALKKY